MEAILSIKNLEKSYQAKKVIKDLSFDVHKGEILCILGPNGAGKSTTLNILTGVLNYEDGMFQSKGKNVHDHLRLFKKRLGIVPQDIALYEELSAEQNIKFFASLYGLKGNALSTSCNQALEFAGLSERRKDKVKTYSGGMKRRLNIACAIAHQPEILILDEPTVGIDPQSRNHILSSIKELRNKGMTIIYTTHYMEEVEEISTRIIIMDGGRIVASGKKEELKEHVNEERLYHIDVDHTEGINEKEFYHIEGVKHVSISASQVELATLKSVENLDRIISVFIQNKVKINSISCESTSLETVFLRLTGKSLRD
ncbi:MAG: ABC transporter ATP-binding protein [Ruminococcus sp.]|nr:ABC transporter ATP-binding protein [Ruminococcus sp.]